MSYDVVIPTTGRPSLGALLRTLAADDGPPPERVLLVDDRRDCSRPLAAARDAGPLADRVHVLAGPARGPAAARNRGWRAARAPWVVFLDDDVVPTPGWRAALAADLDVASHVAGSQGAIRVPLPRDRRPTDWERNVAGLEHARWATADMACRREALAAVGGFDERFPHAYREDADLGLRLLNAGWRIVDGRRAVLHPVRVADAAVSLAKQAGNADDVLMRRVHGRGWRERAGVPRGRRPRHLVTAAAGVAAAAALPFDRALATAAGAAWLAGTAELTAARTLPGPRTARELATMAWTSAAMPFVASWWWARGHVVRPDAALAPRPRPDAVLFDRDGTLVVDVPHNGDPDRVEPMPGARAALDRLRAAGVPTAVVSNQSGVARGLLSPAAVEAVNARLDALVGPLGPVEWCPHAPDAGCACRKPAPGLVLRAAAGLGVDPRRCAVVGDIGADVEAARAAGARGVLVPTARTRPEEIAAAPEVAPDLASAVDLLLDGRRPGDPVPVALAPRSLAAVA
ncbi:MAG TPA: HAD-IIIA family hydrolase [Solirubrobacteraceae bacterium]|nr:HAD-IIIA family hydrolase [Solirubrobacteraceae bacterium]